MIVRFPLVLAGLALTAAMPAAAKPSRPPAPKQAGKAHEQKQEPKSAAATRVADWIAATGDNHALPYVIVDKKAARAFLFDAEGKQLADAPVLVGRTIGDDATPGIGAKTLAEVGPKEKTTSAGRFLAKFGWAVGHHKVLWVDYADSIALHTIPPHNTEHRTRRMLSPTIADNRITYGCINVTKRFYYRGVRPLFRKKGGYVYVLPDIKPLDAVFPLLGMYPAAGSAAAGTGQIAGRQTAGHPAVVASSAP